MTTAYDVPANDLINKVTEKLKENEHVNPPEWASYVKTGVFNDLPPAEDDWWYTRCAAVLRSIYMDGPVGVERLRSMYGGKLTRGVVPAHKLKGSGSILRKALQQLENAGYVRTLKTGRVVSSQGQAFLDNVAYEVKNELLESRPEIAQY
jgi:small subunit ribosomal protein S19e